MGEILQRVAAAALELSRADDRGGYLVPKPIEFEMPHKSSQKMDARVSKNKPTIEQLEIACRHVQELCAAGVTENFAIRTLELMSDIYAKLHKGGTASPHRVRDVKRWSVAALEEGERNPAATAGGHFRVEHGTPRRAFAKKVMSLFKSGALTEAAMNELCERYWDLAVITLEEDRRLNGIARSTPFDTPAARWKAAKIIFPDDDPSSN